MRMPAPLAALACSLALLLTAAAPALVAAQEDDAIVRTDLGIVEPATAPGQELGLWSYQIPAGSELPVHQHPGWQIASIASGELEYTVISGEGTLIGADGTSEAIGPGTYILGVGDGVIENPGMVHFGANRTSEDVTLLAATLYLQGAPLAISVEEQPSAGMPTPSASASP